ncbi:hypothetical protein BHE74_00055976 [Ensete ventricosum]|nr:hypothetical protein GW17_00042396 [Ensete ventricosum]RWW38762.1 hypothetical protein BHE74_00055976 [Ensete ventricosum]
MNRLDWFQTTCDEIESRRTILHVLVAFSQRRQRGEGQPPAGRSLAGVVALGLGPCRSGRLCPGCLQGWTVTARIGSKGSRPWLARSRRSPASMTTTCRGGACGHGARSPAGVAVLTGGDSRLRATTIGATTAAVRRG